MYMLDELVARQIHVSSSYYNQFVFLFPLSFLSLNFFHLFPPYLNFVPHTPFLGPSLSVCVCFSELLRDHRPKASQTSRQASDALHAVQPEGKQEGKTPIHGVCFYCLSSHPLKGCRGFRVGNSQAMTPSPTSQPIITATMFVILKKKLQHLSPPCKHDLLLHLFPSLMLSALLFLQIHFWYFTIYTA